MGRPITQDDLNMIKTIKDTSKILNNLLIELLQDNEDVVKLRGRGLLRGIELSKNIAPEVAQQCINNGLLITCSNI